MHIKRNRYGTIALLGLTVLLSSIGLWVTLSLYLRTTCQALLSGWLESEAISLQEGNLAGALLKNQRVVQSSEFLKGLAIYYIGSRDLEPQFQIGRVTFTPSERDNEIPVGKVVSITSLGLTQQAVYRLSEQPKVLVLFEVKSAFLNTLLMATIFLFIALLLVFAGMLLRLERQEGTWRLLIVKKALTDLIDGQNPSPLLLQECKEITQEWHYLQNKLNELTAKLETQARMMGVADIASQVAHDIRSPLAALDMALKLLPDPSEDKRLLIRGSIGRIRDIANNLLLKNKEHVLSSQANAEGTAEPARSVCLLFGIIEGLITEKRMQFRTKIGIEIDLLVGTRAYGGFADINATEFKRMLSNLVNNAVEILGESGRVTVALVQNADSAIVTVTDNGKGIPSEILARLGQRGETHGKEGGSGLGLYHARTTVESWGGRLEIESTVGLGTTVSIKMPLSPPPKWFVERLELLPNSKIVILDDDSSIHHIWEGRFKSSRIDEANIEIFHFSTPNQLRDYVQEMQSLQETLFLVDYELLGFSETGLDLIETLLIQDRSILVTSRFEEAQIRMRCDRMGVKLVPKGMAAYVPVEVKLPKIKLDGILIDDDSLVRNIWQIAAKDSYRIIEAFGSFETFLEKANLFDRSTPVYIDVNLSNGIRGEEVAEKVYALGFTYIWLATGYDAESILRPSFVCGILGKNPPF